MLEHFFGSKTRVKLLQIFFGSPQRPFYVRELARLIGTQLHGVRREVSNLAKLGIIAELEESELGTRKTGTKLSKYFQLDPNFLLYPELKALLLKAELLEEKVLVETITEKAGDIDLLILTGMFTGAEEVETDMLIVGSLKPVVFARVIKDYEQNSGKTIRYTLMDTKEFTERKQIGDKFLYTIFESKNLPAVNKIDPV
jgi:uncharacterized protein